MAIIGNNIDGHDYIGKAIETKIKSKIDANNVLKNPLKLLLLF